MNRMTRFPLTAAAALLIALAAAGCDKAPEAPVTPPAVSAPAESPAPTVGVSDMDTNERVKTALRQSEALKGADISVVTTPGEVRLSGTVGSQAQKDEAMKLAREADGSRTVQDDLTIRN